MTDANRKLVFADQPDEPESTVAPPPWKLLIVDDEPEVHTVTRLALGDFRYDGRPLEFISAYSGEEARERLAADPGIAVMLLDVVMETDDAGLQVVQYTRRILGNSFIRIILRTGHPGMAPERRIIKAFDINDYRSKTELTQDRMHALMYTSLRAFKRLSNMARSRREKAYLQDEYQHTLERLAQIIQSPAASLQHLANDPAPLADSDVRAELAIHAQSLQALAGKLISLSEFRSPTQQTLHFDSGKLISEIIQEVSAEYASKRVPIRVIGEMPQLTAKPELFRELISELLSNAIVANGSSGEEVQISATSQGKDWVFCIADRGPGISRDLQDVIFFPLQSESQGIGLARCSRIVAMHGGRIWCEPREGGGSCFEFTLPATDHADD